MSVSRVVGDYVWTGTHNFVGEVGLPSGSVENVDVASDADIAASKLEHQYKHTYRQANGTDNADETAAAFTCYGVTGEIIAVHAYNMTAAQNSDTTTVDVQVNGVSILTAVITLNAAALTTITDGTISDGDLVAGDKVTVVINATGSDPGQGILVEIVYTEKAA